VTPTIRTGAGRDKHSSKKAEKKEKKEPEESGERVVVFLYPTIDDEDYEKKEKN